MRMTRAFLLLREEPTRAFLLLREEPTRAFLLLREEPTPASEPRVGSLRKLDPTPASEPRVGSFKNFDARKLARCNLSLSPDDLEILAAFNQLRDLTYEAQSQVLTRCGDLIQGRLKGLLERSLEA
ncbi:hypothetical protein MY4824_002084 [Beauveria thailandica]